MKRLWVMALSVLALAVSAPAEVRAVDLILINGNMVTMDDSSKELRVGRIVQAMAISGAKITALGTNDQMLRLKGPRTRVIDLKGRTVMPGLVEVHVHPNLSLYPPGIHVGVRIGKTPQETVRNIGRMIKEANPGPDEWVFVQLYPDPKAGVPDVQNQVLLWFRAGEFGARQLTALAPDRPLVVTRTLVTRRAGEIKRVKSPLEEPVLVKTVTSQAAEPPRFATAYVGEEQGSHHSVNFLNEMAMQETLKKIPYFKQAILEAYGKEASEAHWFASGEKRFWEGWMFFADIPPRELVKQKLDQMNMWIRAGITSFQSRAGAGGPASDRVLQYMARNDLLPLRMSYLFEVHRGATLEIGKQAYGLIGPIWKKGPDPEGPGSRFWIGGITSELWDSPGPQTCLGPDLSAPPQIKAAEECPEPGKRTYELFKYALAQGWRIADIHTVGSHATRLLARMVDEVIKEGRLTQDEIKGMRIVGAHSLTIGKQPDVVESLKKHGIIIPVNVRRALNAPEGAEWILKHYGPREKAEGFIAPVKSLLDAGVKVVGEAEIFTPKPTDYFAAMGLYVTRQSDRLKRVVAPGEAVPPEIALKLWTAWAAEALHAEHAVGSLEPGKFADFLILNRDILKTPPDQWKTISPLGTFIGGQPAWIEPKLKAELGF